jgi:hypothetical protein
VPNLIANRGVRVTWFRIGGNVRRLMYQSLIWWSVLVDQARRLAAAVNTKDLKRLPDALVYGVR